MSLSICANKHPSVVHEEAWCPLCELKAETDKTIQDLRAQLEDAQSEIRETARDAVAAERERAYNEANQ